MTRARDTPPDVAGRLALHRAWRALEQSGWLADCEAEHREQLCGIAELRRYEAEQVIYHVGEPADGIYGFVQGVIEAAIPRADGEVFLFHRWGTGLWVGDLALFSKRKRLLTLQAAAPSVAVFLPADALLEIAQANPRLMECFYRLSHENVALAFRLLGSLGVSGAQNRVALRLLMLASDSPAACDEVHISQAKLAEFVALSDQSVRRAVRKLEDAGLIEAGYGRFRIIDREGLAALCQYTL
jgi:CRP-like cAMP-binding protein